MMTFIRARIAQRRDAALSVFSRNMCRHINGVELWLVVAIVFFAALMARVAWMF